MCAHISASLQKTVKRRNANYSFMSIYIITRTPITVDNLLPPLHLKTVFDTGIKVNENQLLGNIIHCRCTKLSPKLD